MTQEALKMALEALEEAHYKIEHKQDAIKREQAITAIKEALREHAMREVQRLGQEIEQEPVAIKRMKEWIEYLKRKSDFGQHMKIPSEMSAGTCWELAIELEQFINTTPPQRTEQEPVKYSDYEPDGVHHNKPQQEPVAWEQFYPDIGKPQLTYPPQGIYYTPPQRTWVGLTDEEIKKISKKHKWHEGNVAPHLMPVFRSLEAKLKEKNT